MFVNFSNHPSDKWQRKQIEEAHKYGEIVDCPFPSVPSNATEEDIKKLADESVEKILILNPDAVMCSGEFTLTFSVLKRLMERGILCVCACSERKTVEQNQADGTTCKVSVFEFQGFRKYVY